MTNELTTNAASPFDNIRQTSETGQEFWSARDLMKAVEYNDWRNFEAAIERAKVSAANTGALVNRHFVQVAQLVDANNLGPQQRQDYNLSRFAAYLVVMNGDPRKPAIAAAQQYFAVKTREAEIVQHQIPKTYAAALRAAADAEERAALAEGKVSYLEPRALTVVRAEDRQGGQLVWEMRDVIGDRLRIKPREGLSLLQYLGIITRYGSQNLNHKVDPSWDDLLFPTPSTYTQKDGKQVVYNTGPIRVREGKQEEFLERLEDAFRSRFFVTA